MPDFLRLWVLTLPPSFPELFSAAQGLTQEMGCWSPATFMSRRITPQGRATACELIVDFLDLFSRIPKVLWFLPSMTPLSDGAIWGLIFNMTALNPQINLFMCSTFIEAKKKTNMYLDPKSCLSDVLTPGQHQQVQDIRSSILFLTWPLGREG